MDQITNKIERIVLAALLFTPLVIFPFSIDFDYFYEPKLYMLLFFAVCYLLLLLKFRKQIPLLFASDHINLSLLAYFILLCVSILFALDKSIAIQGRVFRNEGLITIIMYMLLFLAARSVKKLNIHFINFALLSALIVSVYGILQYFGIDPIPRDAVRSLWATNVVFSTIGNPNFLGSYIVLMIPLSIHGYLIEKRYFSLLVFISLFTCLLATMTRGVWLGSLFSIFLYFILLWLNRNKYQFSSSRVLILCVSMLLSVFIINLNSSNVLFNRFFSIRSEAILLIKNNENVKTIGSYRWFLWARVIELIKQKPWFGYGIENMLIPFMNAYRSDIVNILKLEIVFDKAHNEYLNIAVSSGIPSLIAYLSFVGLCLKTGIIRLKENPIYLALFASVIGYLIQATFNISVVSVAYVFWIFLGLLVGGSLKSNKKQ